MQASSSSWAQASSNYDVYAYRRSRSNSPNEFPYLIDLSYFDLIDCESNLLLALEEIENTNEITNILLNNNLLQQISPVIVCFQYLETLDLSSNQLKTLGNELCRLTKLRTLIVKENFLEDTSLPKDLMNLDRLEVINFSGNLFTQFPYQLLELKSLREIYLGSNKIGHLPRNFENLQRLEVLYLGGNQIKLVPDELCQLRNLTSLNLSNNHIQNLPKNIAKLRNIKNLALHGNDLATLPIELVKLNLHELSLRNNPLVNRFAKEYTYNVPSLLELCGRVIKINKVNYESCNLPSNLINYLNSAQSCLNPKCKGVYFTSKVEHVKFVDFCGKYRLPLMQYLCSSTCNEKIANKNSIYSSSSDSSGSDTDENVDNKLLSKILIG
jgi:Leucine-rich repeat (LRR) protein